MNLENGLLSSDVTADHLQSSWYSCVLLTSWQTGQQDTAYK